MSYVKAFGKWLLATVATTSLVLIAYKLTFSTVEKNPKVPQPAIDYTNAVVILLTTVSVIFTVCALILAILGIVGFRNLKRDAGKFASQQALSSIDVAFSEGGIALQQIENEFTREDGHLKKWVERKLRQEVIELLPLIIDRLPNAPERSRT